MLDLIQIRGIFKSMATITLDTDPKFDKNRFKDAAELLAYLTSQIGGFLYEDDSELNEKLDRRIKEMDENPSSVTSLDDALKFARLGK